MKYLFLLLGLVMFIQVMQGQQEEPLVITAEYFDTTPPLKDMEVILPGERDRSWLNGVVENKSVEDSIRNQRADIPDGFTDPALQKNYPAGRGINGPVRNFDGVGNVNGVYPPDTDGDVSLDYYFQMINLSFAIWDKSGNLLYGPVNNSTLWNGFIGPWTGTNDGDPIVLYDELADRWMASQFAINTSNGTYWQLVAVSQTSDPLGAYHRYAFQMPAFNDYPKLSVWTDAYYATFNMFGSYTRVGVAAFERDSMLVGSPARMVYYNQPNGTFSMLPADFDGDPPPAGAPCYFAHLRTFSSQNFEIYEFDVNWDNPASSSFSVVNTLSPLSFNPNVDDIPQPNTSQRLDALNMMLMYRLQYRNFGTHEVLLTNHTVNAGGRAGIRWYEFRKDTNGDWFIYQQGTYAPDNEHRWMASIAMNGNGDIAIGYNKSSSTTFPSIYYTGRRANAPLGEMNIEEVLAAGGTHNQGNINRWGDYSCLSVDPSDDSTFWYTGEYKKSAWKTRITSFNLGPIEPPQVNAGPDDVVCETEPYQTQATAIYQQTVQWETSGDGFFTDPTKVNAVYLRGTQDLLNGEVDLWVTAFGYLPGTQVTDSLNLSFAKMAVASAGPDTTICVGETMMLNGSAMYYSSLYWTTEGDGTFKDSTVLNAEYTPGPADITNGFVKLSLHAVDSLPCEGVSHDKMTLTIDECTGVREFSNLGPQLSIVPNPATDVVLMTIHTKRAENVILTIRSITGQVLFTQQLGMVDGICSRSFDLGYFESGTYLVTVNSETGIVIDKLILK